MEKALTQQLETMCRMLTKTREDVKVLKNQVSTLHLVLTGENPPPEENRTKEVFVLAWRNGRPI